MDSSSAITSSLLPSMYFPSNRYLLLASSCGQRRTNSSISSFEIRRSSICRCSAIGSDCCIRVSFCTLKSSYFTSYEEDSTMEKRENETLTVQDIKQILNISINAAYNLIHSKSFPVIRIGNSFRVPREPFYEWMKSSHTIMN